jgi:hypothetical protein
MKAFPIAAFLLVLIAGLASTKARLAPAETAPTSAIDSYAARTDFAVVPIPTPLPNMAGAQGAGTSVLDPDFHTRIYRLTDINTAGETRYAPQQEWQMNCGGWGAFRVSNVDSTKIFICNNGGGTFLLPFDPATGTPGAAKRLPHGVGFPHWSKTQQNVAFALANSKNPEVVRLDFSVWPPRITPVVNLAKVQNCAQQFAGKSEWKELSAAWDDATFAVAVGEKFQGSAHTVYVWNAKAGCQVYDTEAETVNGARVPGATESFSIHAIKISGDGKIVMVGGDRMMRHFWDIGTATVETARAMVNVGHFAMGYSSFLNTAESTSDGKWCKLGMAIRPLTVLTSVKYLLTSKQCGDTLTVGDDHVSWNNDDTTDKQPFATSTVSGPPNVSIKAAWEDEILVFMQDGAVHREAHTFDSGRSKFFACRNAIGSISQDGKWFFFSSDWEGGLGRDSAGNPRCDDFAAELH